MVVLCFDARLCRDFSKCRVGRRGREGTVSTAPSTPQAPRPSSGWTVTTSLISFGGSLLSCPSCGSSGGIGCTAGRSSSAEDPVGSTTSVAVGTITADGGLERAALLTPHPISGRRACFEAVIDAQSKRKKPCPTSQAADAERPCRRDSLFVVVVVISRSVMRPVLGLLFTSRAADAP